MVSKDVTKESSLVDWDNLPSDNDEKEEEEEEEELPLNHHEK